MKISLYFVFLFSSLIVKAQIIVPSLVLSVSELKTTNIIFPYAITKADIGSPDVIGHKDLRIGNVLFLKANRKDFLPTNLSVYTNDGKFYSFIVRFSDDPDTLNLSFVPDSSTKMSNTLDALSNTVFNQPSFLHRNVKDQEINMTLNGIFLRNQSLWFRFEVSNDSQLPLMPENFRFFVGDRQVTKRMARQETELYPIWKSPCQPVEFGGYTSYLFAFPIFTLSKQQNLLIQLREKNGGRLIIIKIPYKTILKAHLF